MLALSAATRMRPWDLLETSIAEAAANPRNILVTVYLGGGTPSLLRPDASLLRSCERRRCR